MPTYWQDRTVPSVILPLKKKRIFLGRSLNFRFLMRNKARSIPEISLLRGVFLELAFSLGQDLQGADWIKGSGPTGTGYVAWLKAATGGWRDPASGRQVFTWLGPSHQADLVLPGTSAPGRTNHSKCLSCPHHISFIFHISTLVFS
jgi:hypothetical protein